MTVGFNGTILTRTNNGIKWQLQNSRTTKTLQGIVWSDTQHLWIVTGESGIILTSPDGINWTQQSSGTNSFLTAVTAID